VEGLDKSGNRVPAAKYPSRRCSFSRPGSRYATIPGVPQARASVQLQPVSPRCGHSPGGSSRPARTRTTLWCFAAMRAEGIVGSHEGVATGSSDEAKGPAAPVSGCVRVTKMRPEVPRRCSGGDHPSSPGDSANPTCRNACRSPDLRREGRTAAESMPPLEQDPDRNVPHHLPSHRRPELDQHLLRPLFRRRAEFRAPRRTGVV